MPTVHHHVTDEAQMERIGEALPKWLGVILRVCINRLSRLSARTAVKGARNRARPPLSIKPGLRPVSLFTAETVVALQSLPLRLMNTNYTRIERQRHLLNEKIKQANQMIRQILSIGAEQPGASSLTKNERLLDYFLDPTDEPRITHAPFCDPGGEVAAGLKDTASPDSRPTETRPCRSTGRKTGPSSIRAALSQVSSALTGQCMVRPKGMPILRSTPS
jgi:hypothetical protein